MKKIIITLPEIKLVGVMVKTNNQLEADPSTAKIGLMSYQYFNESLANKISNRKKIGTTYCVYTDYESDFTGHYNCLIGEEVEYFDSVAENFKKIIIPEQRYIKFTTDPGTIPMVSINCWQKIWQMDTVTLGGKRNYKADFDIYDERSYDPQNAIIDIYVGI